MKTKKRTSWELSAEEVRLVDQLRQHPQMMERVQSILEIAYDASGPLRTADEVEGMLIEAVRHLGHTTMSQWAQGAEERVSQELRREDATVRSRKKKR
jgi:hypothetical protein